MTRKIKRTKSFQLELNIADETFIRTPRDSQRNWLLNRIVKESSDELVHLDKQASSFLRGSDSSIALDRAQGDLDELEIMEDWQVPVMKEMSGFVAQGGGDILEIGMGRGIASDFIQEYSPDSHTLVECNDKVVEFFNRWVIKYPGRNISMLHGMWQDRISSMATYDGILFHTYPLSEQEFVDQVVHGVTFAEHFFSTAHLLLKPGGVMTYLTNEIDSLSRAHQRALFRYFSEFTLSLLTDLDIPQDTRDSLWVPQLVMIKVRK